MRAQQISKKLNQRELKSESLPKDWQPASLKEASSKKRKVENTSFLATDEEDTSSQEPSSISMHSTLDGVLEEISQLSRLVTKQQDQIDLLKNLLKKQNTVQNVAAEVVKEVKSTVSQRVMGMCKKAGKNFGRLFYAVKNDQGDLEKGSYKWLPTTTQLLDVAYQVSGEKKKNGKLVKWSSWKDSEEDQFVMGTYEEETAE
jgi:hypothetical protein